MKKFFVCGALLLTLFTGCKKKHVEPETVAQAHNNSSYLSLTSESYLRLQEDLKREFNPAGDPADSLKLANTDLKSLPAGITEIPKLEALKQLGNDDAIISRHPELAGLRSCLKVYAEALAIADKDKLQELVNKYNWFLFYIKEVNSVGLLLPKELAAVISADGLIKIDNEIVKYGKNCIKIIKDGDESKIKLLDQVNESTKEITVLKETPESAGSNARLESSGTHVEEYAWFYHPANGNFAVALSKREFWIYGPGCCGGPQYYSHYAGARAYVFLFGQLFPATTIVTAGIKQGAYNSSVGLYYLPEQTIQSYAPNSVECSASMIVNTSSSLTPQYPYYVNTAAVVTYYGNNIYVTGNF